MQLRGVELDATGVPGLQPSLGVQLAPTDGGPPQPPDLLQGLFAVAAGAHLALQDVRLHVSEEFVTALRAWGCVAGLPEWDVYQVCGAGGFAMHHVM